MHYTVIAASFLLILTLAFPVAAQYPGRYPGGISSPYPGSNPTGPSIPIPRRSKDKKADDRHGAATVAVADRRTPADR